MNFTNFMTSYNIEKKQFMKKKTIKFDDLISSVKIKRIKWIKI